MKRFTPILAAMLLVAVVVAAPARAEFGLGKFDVTFTNEDGTLTTQAGSHPFAMDTRFDVNYTETAPGKWELDGEVRDDFFQQVPGFVGDATAIPPCELAELIKQACKSNTQVGIIAYGIFSPKSFGGAPVYALSSPPGVPVRLAFLAPIVNQPVLIDNQVRQGGDYNVLASQRGLPQILAIYGARLQLWGNPADPDHGRFRPPCGGFGVTNGVPVEKVEFVPGSGSCSANAPEVPFLTLPGSCTGPAETVWAADSWQNIGVFVGGGTLTHDFAEPPNPQGFTGCGKVPFSPSVSAGPSSASAESPSGLDFDLNFDQGGLKTSSGIAQSEAKKIVTTLPEGVTVNPSVGEGLGFCSPADYERESLSISEGEGCPDNSKVGTVHVDSPLLGEGVDGSLYLAQQGDPATPELENPFDSLIALYIVLRNPNQGIFVKIPVKVEPDHETGQLVATADDLPQLPFSHLNLHFREGKRSPLVTPPACGSYDVVSKLSPWSDPENPVTAISPFQITGGIDQGPCPPGGVSPFHPDFEAGSINNNAKSYSPFDMRLTRHDGEQDMTKFGSILPPGVVGKLAGVSKCPDAAIALAASKTGRQEIASPSCPTNSQIGRTLVGAGVGPALTYVPGKVYLGGPYKGDPLSVVSVTPAVAGPFDAGDVVVRIALTLNPETAEVEVDGAKSDPIPHILKGIPLKVRDVRVYVDRSNFILNPTSCDPSSARATLFGGYLDVFSDADDIPVSLSTPYQAANCLNLGFKPALKINLNGGTRRGAHPALKAVLNARPGDANIGGATVTLPKSAFLDQSHIRTICTRVQFAAKACPPGAQYGFAKAWTPLLDEPLEGPVYLRSSNHKLPDLVLALHGLVDVNVSSRIDSKNGGIRNSFETIPDAPVSKFILTMQGGKKGLVVNSRNLCAGKNRADVRFTGQNGVAYDFNRVITPSCGGKQKHKRHSK